MDKFWGVIIVVLLVVVLLNTRIDQQSGGIAWDKEALQQTEQKIEALSRFVVTAFSGNFSPNASASVAPITIVNNNNVDLGAALDPILNKMEEQGATLEEMKRLQMITSACLALKSIEPKNMTEKVKRAIVSMARWVIPGGEDGSSPVPEGITPEGVCTLLLERVDLEQFLPAQ